MSFHDFTRFIFEFLLELAHMSLLKVFMQDLRFLDFYMSNDPKLKLELRKLQNSGLSEIWYRGRSAKGPRTVRLCWAEFARGSVSRVAVKKFKGGRSARVPRIVREWTERWG